jgi:hypothetical protein
MTLLGFTKTRILKSIMKSHIILYLIHKDETKDN